MKPISWLDNPIESFIKKYLYKWLKFFVSIKGDATKKYILVPGGAGFIGSHCVVELIQAGYTPIVLDNECNSSTG